MCHVASDPQEDQVQRTGYDGRSDHFDAVEELIRHVERAANCFNDCVAHLDQEDPVKAGVPAADGVAHDRVLVLPFADQNGLR